MDTDVNGGAVSLLALNALNMDHKSTSVALQDLAGLLALVVTSGDLK